MKRSEVIDIKGIEFTVDFDYQPYEKEVRFDSNMEGYPGCAEDVTEIYEIRHKGEDFFDLFEELDTDFSLVVEAIFKSIREHEEF